MVLALFYMCGGNHGTTGTDHLEHFQTITRDALHNLAYPRSAPGSRKRYVTLDYLAAATHAGCCSGLGVKQE